MSSRRATAFSYGLIAAVFSVGFVIFWPLASQAARCADWNTSCNVPGTAGVLAAMAGAVVVAAVPTALAWPLAARRRQQQDNQHTAHRLCRTLAVATTALSAGYVTLCVLGELNVLSTHPNTVDVVRALAPAVVLAWLPTAVGVRRAVTFSMLNTILAMAALAWTAHVILLAPLGFAYAGLSLIASTSALLAQSSSDAAPTNDSATPMADNYPTTEVNGRRSRTAGLGE